MKGLLLSLTVPGIRPSSSRSTSICPTQAEADTDIAMGRARPITWNGVDLDPVRSRLQRVKCSRHHRQRLRQPTLLLVASLPVVAVRRANEMISNIPVVLLDAATDSIVPNAPPQVA